MLPNSIQIYLGWLAAVSPMFRAFLYRYFHDEFTNYLGAPFGLIWKDAMTADTKPDQPPALMTQDHQTIEEIDKMRLALQREIDRSNPRCMVAQESLPAL